MSALKNTLTNLSSVLDLFRAINTDIQANAIQLFLIVATHEGADGVPMQTLENLLGQSQAAVSRNVAMFTDWTRHHKQGPGLMQRTENPMNRRQKLVRMTPKGQHLADSVLGLLRS